MKIRIKYQQVINKTKMVILHVILGYQFDTEAELNRFRA